MKHFCEGSYKEVKIIKNMEDPFSWAEGKSGWIILHPDELDILKSIMETLREPNVEEYEVSLVDGTEKKKMYRLHVKNLSMAYKIIDIARKLKIHERIPNRKLLI